jgi:cyclopropane fatty-acyl-phospholipid synthase-like methyltransferase
MSVNCDTKPFSQACEENRAPIEQVLAGYLASLEGTLLEIGSGTGQHAVAFSRRFPRLTWQTSDLASNLPGIRLWVAEAHRANLPPPIELDVTAVWPNRRFDAVFSANTAHIMSDAQVAAMFRGLAASIVEGGVFLFYGPFNYAGRYTSESNERFDAWLKQRDPRSGIKDFAVLDALARAASMRLVGDHPMPANNRTLVWRRLDVDQESRG